MLLIVFLFISPEFPRQTPKPVPLKFVSWEIVEFNSLIPAWKSETESERKRVRKIERDTVWEWERESEKDREREREREEEREEERQREGDAKRERERRRDREWKKKRYFLLLNNPRRQGQLYYENKNTWASDT